MDVTAAKHFAGVPARFRVLFGLALSLSVIACADDSRSGPTTFAPTPKREGAVWSVTPGENLTGSSQSFTANVRRLACNDGVTGAVWAPTVKIGDSEIVVTFTVEPHTPVAHNCLGNNEVPFVVKIGEPIGHRQLVDGQCLPGGEGSSTSYCVDDAGIRWKP